MREGGIIMLLYEIKKGESKTLEFKERLPANAKNYLKTIVAFSNCLGGKLIIGVSDKNNQIVGIDMDIDIFTMMDDIANAIADNCEPQIIPNIYPVTIDKKTIIVIEVVKGSLQPYYIKSLGKDNGTYIRIGATSHPADVIYLSEMELKKRNISFDSLPCEKFIVTDELIDKCCNMIYESKMLYEHSYQVKRITLENLINWKVLIEENNRLIASNAFAIMMQEDDTYFDNSRVQCGLFKGDTRSFFIDKKEYNGPIFKLIESAYDFIIRHINVGLNIDGLNSLPDYEIDPFIIREVLNNAFHHRSYIDDGAIQVSIFDNKLEITSPGSIYNNLSIEQIISGRTSSRNKILTRLFKEMGLIEEWGTGLQRIIDKCKETGLPDPKFEDMDTAFRVTIYRKNTVIKEKMIEFNNNSVKNMTELMKQIENFNHKDQQKVILIYEYLKDHNFITSTIAQTLLNVSESTCRRILVRCEKANILKSSGNTKSRKYYLK